MTIDDADKTQPVTYIYPVTMANEDGTVNYGSFNFTAQSERYRGIPLHGAQLLQRLRRLGRRCTALGINGQPDSHLEAHDDTL